MEQFARDHPYVALFVMVAVLWTALLSIATLGLGAGSNTGRGLPAVPPVHDDRYLEIRDQMSDTLIDTRVECDREWFSAGCG